MAVADRHSERIGGIIGLRDFFEIEDYPRHLLHLLLFGASVTDDALFDLQGCILENRDTVLLRGENEDSPRLADIDNRFRVVVIKKFSIDIASGLYFSISSDTPSYMRSRRMLNGIPAGVVTAP